MGNVCYCAYYYSTACCGFGPAYSSFESTYMEDDDPIVGCFPRSNTCDLSNDPRTFMGNIIEKRLGAFETIVVASILLASTSATYLLETETNLEKFFYIGAGYVSAMLMGLVFVVNMICVLVLTLQYYQVFRLMSCGPTGFECSKDYYTTPTVMEMRHFGVRCFSVSLPFFIVAIAFKVVDRFSLERTLPIFVYLCVCGVVCFIMMGRMNGIFVRLYAKCKRYEHLHFQEVENRMLATKAAAMQSKYYTVGGQ
jgi:hypothetical protein